MALFLASVKSWVVFPSLKKIFLCVGGIRRSATNIYGKSGGKLKNGVGCDLMAHG